MACGRHLGFNKSHSARRPLEDPGGPNLCCRTAVGFHTSRTQAWSTEILAETAGKVATGRFGGKSLDGASDLARFSRKTPDS